jgi:hypothetical protein
MAGCADGMAGGTAPTRPAELPVAGYHFGRRYPCLAFRTGLYSEDFRSRTTLASHPPAAMSAAERFQLGALVDDLLTKRPALLFVDKTRNRPAFHGREFGFLDYFSLAPRFVDFLRQYEPLTRVDAFGVYRRKRSPTEGAVRTGRRDPLTP